MTARKTRVILWWSLGLMTVAAIAFGFFMHEIPPRPPSWSAEQVAEYYQEHSVSIRIGAMIAGWVSAFQIPFAVVFAAQVARQEQGGKVWSALVLVSGALTAVFFALPPLAWGTAAFSPERAPEITQVMHQFGQLTFITTDQMYIGMWVAIAVVCFLPKKVEHSPFPRWWGYVTIWSILLFESGAVAFMADEGPFRVNGVLAFWIPLAIYGGWMVAQSYLVLRVLKAQELEEDEAERLEEREAERLARQLAQLPEVRETRTAVS